MLNNYNRIAPFYDLLAKIISFNEISKAHESQLFHLKTKNNCLIIGGGSGQFLNKLWEINPNIEIDYLDTSHEMLRLAKKNTPEEKESQICFLTSRTYLKKKYDCIIAFFYLDLYNKSDLESEIEFIIRKTRKKGIILVSDFTYSKHWLRQLYDRAVILFINLTTNGKIVSFPDIQQTLNAQSNIHMVSCILRKQLIFSNVYEKY